MKTNGQSSKNGSVSKYAQILGGERGRGVSYSQVDAETLRGAVVSVVEGGDAILFGRTSDGGALSVRVLSDGRTHAWYPSDASELLELLEALRSAVSA